MNFDNRTTAHQILGSWNRMEPVSSDPNDRISNPKKGRVPGFSNPDREPGPKHSTGMYSTQE
jgi:hypothetical protein